MMGPIPPVRGVAACLGAMLLWMPLACDAEPLEARDPVQLSLHLRTKGSCGLSPVLFEGSCLAALEVRVQDLAGRTLSRHCEVLAPRSDTLADLLSRTEPALAFGTLTSQGKVIFRVTGIHDAGELASSSPAALCALADRSRHWLFWGESKPVDLGEFASLDAIDSRVVVPIDCRDCTGGCETLATPQCPAAMPVSYCVPYALGLSCTRRCDNDEECFEGRVTCAEEGSRCDASLGDPTTGNTGGFCYPCRSSADCDLDFACVAPIGQSEGLCAPRCPDNRCLDGALCMRLGADLQLLGPGGPRAGAATP